MNQNQPMTEDLLAKFVDRETDVNEYTLVENWLNENEKNKNGSSNVYKSNTENKQNLNNLSFFGLSIAYHKELLIPSHNVIIYIHGGGFFSQTSESSLAHLIEYIFLLNQMEHIYKLSHNQH